MAAGEEGVQMEHSRPEWTFTLDHDPIHTFDDDAKIAWLQGRVEKMLLVPLRDAHIRTRFNQEPKPAYDLNLGLMTLACCAIEALGRFLLGGSKKTVCPTCENRNEEPSAAKCFREFIRTYVADYKPVAQPLYESFRCALAHSFAIRDGCLSHSLGRPFLKGSKSTPHRIDFDRFIAGVVAGISRYFSDLRSCADLRENFIKHWNSEYGFWVLTSKREEERHT
jgi:hypothetical protein